MSSGGVRGRQHTKTPPVEPADVKAQHAEVAAWITWIRRILPCRCVSSLAPPSRQQNRRLLILLCMPLLLLVAIFSFVDLSGFRSSVGVPGLRFPSKTVSCIVREPPTVARVFLMANATARMLSACAGQVRVGRPADSLPWLRAAAPYPAAFDECAASRPVGGMWLTYANINHADGAGSQLQRIIGIVSAAKALNLGYVHSPIASVGYQGLAALEKGSGNSTTVDRWNAVFGLGSAASPGATCRGDVSPDGPAGGLGADGCRHIFVDYPNLDALEALARSSCSPREPPTLVHATYASDIIDKRPALGRHPELSFSKLLPWLRVGKTAERLRIAVHVRRGELFVVDSDRMLPNSYYLTICAQLSSVLSVMGLPHVFEIYTEQAQGKLTVSGSDHGIAGRIAAPIVIDPAASHLEDFDIVEPKIMVINLDAIETLQRMATAHILVMSRSSFSYVAASLMDMTHSVVVYYPFWHRPLPGWTVVDELVQPGPVSHELWLRTRSILAAAASRVFFPPACALRADAVPRIVHVVALDEGASSVSPRMRALDDALRALNPGYEVNIVDLAAASTFLERSFPSHAAHFKSLQSSAMRTALVRALLVFARGGFVLDPDVQPLLSFDALLVRVRALSSPSTHSVFCLGARSSPPFEGAPGFFAAPAGNPLLLSLADGATESAAAERRSQESDASASSLQGRSFFTALLDHYPAMRPYAAVDGTYFLQEVEVDGGRVFNTLPDESVLVSAGWADSTWPGAP